MAVYLYTPPQYRMTSMMRGSLRVTIPVSTTVYRKNGVWHNTVCGGVNPAPNECDMWIADDRPELRLRLFFTKPMVVPDALHDELLALAPASAAWSAGTLTLL